MADNVAITAGAGTSIATDDVGGVQYQRVKVDVGGDGATVPVVGTAAGLPVVGYMPTATGNITTQNLVPAGTATAGSAVELIIGDAGSAAIQVTGTYTGALSLQVTVNGTTWVTVGGTPFLNLATGGYLATITSALQSVFQVDCGGFARIRITGLAAMTGTATVTIVGNPAASMVALDAALPAGTNAIGVVDTELPAAAAMSDAVANPTTPMIGAVQMIYNGSTFERARGNWNTTTGDTGAKTTTGNGATQTNFNARGVIVQTNITAVSGTTPSMTLTLQYSLDGTIWIPLLNSAAITAAGQNYLFVHPNMVAVANNVAQFPLPRVWRMAWAITGTTPSFTIGAIAVAYVI